MDEILVKNISEEERLQIMEQALVDTYFVLRKNQGYRNSRLANGLETFINGKDGLNLGEKYHGLGKVAHNVKGLTAPVKLTEVRKYQGDELEDIIKRLTIALDDRHVKTKKGELIKTLLNDLKDNENNALFDVNEMKKIISMAYFSIPEAATLKTFRQSNYADVLRKFMMMNLKWMRKQ